LNQLKKTVPGKLVYYDRNKQMIINHEGARMEKINYAFENFKLNLSRYSNRDVVPVRATSPAFVINEQ